MFVSGNFVSFVQVNSTSDRTHPLYPLQILACVEVHYEAMNSAPLLPVFEMFGTKCLYGKTLELYRTTESRGRVGWPSGNVWF